MERSSTVNVRIEPDIKAEAEEIFSAIGLSTATAINAFYRQVILRKGLPFSLTSVKPPLSLANMTQEQLDTELAKGLASIKGGRTYSEEEVEAMFRDWKGR